MGRSPHKSGKQEVCCPDRTGCMLKGRPSSLLELAVTTLLLEPQLS